MTVGTTLPTADNGYSPGGASTSEWFNPVIFVDTGVITNSPSSAWSGGTGANNVFYSAYTDVFVFNSPLTTGRETDIVGFSAASDTIRLDDAVFAGLAAGPLLAASYAENLTGTATAARPQIIYDTDNGLLYFDADGTGAGARVHFATLAANPDVSNADFFVF